MAGGGGGGDGEPEFQVAPLIDVLLVMLIFFMSICTDQSLKIDRSIELPVTPAGTKAEDKGLSCLINIAWDKGTQTPIFKLDDRLITDIEAEEPSVDAGKGKTNLIREIERRKAALDRNKDTKDRMRILVRADKQVQAKYVAKALKWGADAGVDNIVFSGTNQ